MSSVVKFPKQPASPVASRERVLEEIVQEYKEEVEDLREAVKANKIHINLLIKLLQEAELLAKS